MVFDAAAIVDLVLKLNVAVEGNWVELSVGLEAGRVVRLGVTLPVGFANTVDIGRVVANLLNLLVGLDSFESLDCDLPNLKSLANHPCFSAFCSTSNGLCVTAKAGEIFTGEGWVDLLSNKNEDHGVCSDRKLGTFLRDVDVKVAEIGSGPNCGDSRVCLLRAGLLFEATRTPPGLLSAFPSIRVFDQPELAPRGSLGHTE